MRGAMYALLPKRCPHCVGVVRTLTLEDADGSGTRTALICERCDGVPGRVDEAVHLPPDWS